MTAFPPPTRTVSGALRVSCFDPPVNSPGRPPATAARPRRGLRGGPATADHRARIGDPVGASPPAEPRAGERSRRRGQYNLQKIFD
ncbi:unnamed protein product [Caretta caretta]